MAKKKRRVPQKKCPKCGAMVHVRTRKCPECGREFEYARKPASASRARGSATSSPRIARAGSKATGPLAAVEESIATIKDLGGFEKVKELLSTMKEAQAAVNRLGGLENAEALIESVEALKNL